MTHPPCSADISDAELAAWARNWHWNDCADDKPVDPSIYFRDVRMLKAYIAKATASIQSSASAQAGHMTYATIEAAFDAWRKSLTVVDRPSNQEIFSQGYVAGWNDKEASGQPQASRLPPGELVITPIYAAQPQAEAAPIAWIDIRTTGELKWERRIVVTNPQYVERNGPENFAPLYAGEPLAIAPSQAETYTEVCKMPGCPRGGRSVEIVGSAIEAMRVRNLSEPQAVPVDSPNVSLAQALYEAERYGIGVTSDTNQRVILQAAKDLAAQPQALPTPREDFLRRALEGVQWAGRDSFRCVDCGGQPSTGHTNMCTVSRALALSRPEDK